MTVVLNQPSTNKPGTGRTLPTPPTLKPSSTTPLQGRKYSSAPTEYNRFTNDIIEAKIAYDECEREKTVLKQQLAEDEKYIATKLEVARRAGEREAQCDAKLIECDQSLAKNAQIRADNAQIRTNNTQTRTNNALTRTNNEQTRTNNEQTRTNNVQTRTNNEQTRTNNEQTRTNNEQTREENNSKISALRQKAYNDFEIASNFFISKKPLIEKIAKEPSDKTAKAALPLFNTLIPEIEKLKLRLLDGSINEEQEKSLNKDVQTACKKIQALEIVTKKLLNI